MLEGTVIYRFLLLLLIVLLYPIWVKGQEDASKTNNTLNVLTVGIKEAPPFTFKNSAGEWEGISVWLWQEIMNEIGLAYKFKEFDLQELIGGLSDGSLDAAIGALTITAKRELLFDFTHSFFYTGLGVAVTKTQGKGFYSVFKQFLQVNFLRVLSIFVICLLIFTLLIWFFERQMVKKNPEKLSMARASFKSSLWWSLVILIGKNDRHPVSFLGRALALIWMIASLIIAASLTAIIASILTVNKIQGDINNVHALTRLRTATVSSSSSDDFLTEAHINFKSLPSVNDGLELLRANRIDAFVYDRPLLRYLINRDFINELDIHDLVLESQSYGFALKSNSPYREKINQSLLTLIHNPAWDDVVFSYLGNDD